MLTSTAYDLVRIIELRHFIVVVDVYLMRKTLSIYTVDDHFPISLSGGACCIMRCWYKDNCWVNISKINFKALIDMEREFTINGKH